VTNSLKRMSFRRAPESSKRSSKFNPEDIFDQNTEKELTTEIFGKASLEEDSKV
jgi:hypothetical protein